jgi:AcrR family transcriptional regulator
MAARSGPTAEVARRRSDSARAKGRLTLTRADVVTAGMRLLDTEGAEKLSMRKLAESLGTVSSTLYWHVRDRDELLRLILDETLREVVVPEDGEWDVRLLATLVRCYDALRPRPALVDVLWHAAWDLGPQTLRVADGLTGLVAASGLPRKEVGDCYLGLISLLFGFVAAAGAPGNPSYREVRARQSAADDEPAAAPRYPNLMRYGPGADPQAMARQFRYAAERFVAGVRTRVADVESTRHSRRTR